MIFTVFLHTATRAVTYVFSSGDLLVVKREYQGALDDWVRLQSAGMCRLVLSNDGHNYFVMFVGYKGVIKLAMNYVHDCYERVS